MRTRTSTITSSHTILHVDLKDDSPPALQNKCSRWLELRICDWQAPSATFKPAKLPIMSWYYAIGNERLGPVEDEEWKQLVASGQIQPDTLVWQKGMADWMPFSALSTSAAPATGATCAECGRAFPPDELVPMAGRDVCASCKPLVLQRMKEGAGAPISAEDPERLVERIHQRDYHIKVQPCLSRAIALVKSRFWLCVGTTFVLYIVMAAAGAIPCLGILASMVVNGPVIGGLYWFFLKLIREGDATIGDGFTGFNREFVQLMLCTIVSTVAMGVFFVPVGILAAVVGNQNPDAMPAIVVIAYLVAVIPVIYFGIAWLFAPALIIDKGFRFWPAMEVSRRVVNMHWFRVFALPLVIGLIMAGVMLVFVAMIAALGVAGGAAGDSGSTTSGIAMSLMLIPMFLAVFFLMPVFFAAISYAYEDIFGDTATEKTS
jgi:hypothetical protein